MELIEKNLFDNIIIQKLWQFHLLNVQNQFPTTLELRQPSDILTGDILEESKCIKFNDLMIANELGVKVLPYSIMQPIVYKESIEKLRTYKDNGVLITHIPQYIPNPEFNISIILRKLNIQLDYIIGKNNSSSITWSISSNDIDSVANSKNISGLLSPLVRTDAAMKIIPLVNSDLWNNKLRLEQATRIFVKNDDLYTREQLKKTFSFAQHEDMDTETLRKFIVNELSNVNNRILNEINESDRQAYVEGIISYWLSNLVTSKLTPFHPLYYCSFRANFDRISGLDENNQYSTGLPVVCHVTQHLESSLNDLIINQDWFGILSGNSQNPLILHNDVMAMLAQIVFGIHIFHILTSGTFNNLSTNNLMYEIVQEDTILYYVLLNSDIGNLIEKGYITEVDDLLFNAYYSGRDVYFAIPSNGIKIKATDPSFARIYIKDDFLYVDQYMETNEIANNTRIQNDLVSFFSNDYYIWTYLYELFLQYPETSSFCYLFLEATSCNVNYPYTDFNRLIQDNPVYLSINQCQNNVDPLSCTRNEIIRNAYSYNSRYCNNVGTYPEALIKYFQSFIVNEQDVPPCDIIFNLYPRQTPII